MPFRYTIRVANASPYERSDFVECNLDACHVPADLDNTSLRLFRVWDRGNHEEIPYQLDYPFGRQTPFRILTFFSRSTPKGLEDYSQATADFLLEEGTPKDFGGVGQVLLQVGHRTSDGKWHRDPDPSLQVTGVELSNHKEESRSGLKVCFSLVPRPNFDSPFNMAGAVTSIVHHAAARATDAGEMLESPEIWRQSAAPQKRWGQLTAIDLYATPWDPNWYQHESLLGQPGDEPAYTLAFSRQGPLRATVSLRSEAIRVRFTGSPFFRPKEKTLCCRLYRMICLYPESDLYTEQLFLRPEGNEFDKWDERVSLAFRAHFHSNVDYPAEYALERAAGENVPDYFAVQWSFEQQRVYAFASDSHVRALHVQGSDINWRLQLGHEHRCVHLFKYFGLYPGLEHHPTREIGSKWYEMLYRPLQPVPLQKYLVNPPQRDAKPHEPLPASRDDPQGSHKKTTSRSTGHRSNGESGLEHLKLLQRMISSFGNPSSLELLMIALGMPADDQPPPEIKYEDKCILIFKWCVARGDSGVDRLKIAISRVADGHRPPGVEATNQEEPADKKNSRQHRQAKQVRQARKSVRLFVSYARKNLKRATEFLDRLMEQLGPSRRFDYQHWRDTTILVGEGWHDEITQALDKCHIGLLLVSPAFLDSQFITEEELPHFIGDDAKPVIPVLLEPVSERHDLKGLEKVQLFTLPAAKHPVPYANCRGDQKRREFVEALFDQLEDRLDSLDLGD